MIEIGKITIFNFIEEPTGTQHIVSGLQCKVILKTSWSEMCNRQRLWHTKKTEFKQLHGLCCL